MNVREKFETTGLFVTMDSIKHLKYMDLITPENMDIIYMSNNGLRLLSYMGENNTVEKLAKILIEMYGNKWEKLYDIAISELPTDYNYKETQTEKVDDTGSNTVDFTSTDTGQVNAYNDDDFVNDTKQDTKTVNTGSNNNLKNREYTKEVLNGSKSDNLFKILEYLKNNYFNDIIIKDINSLLTLSIYD